MNLDKQKAFLIRFLYYAVILGLVFSVLNIFCPY
jgi:hypothetical protein